MKREVVYKLVYGLFRPIGWVAHPQSTVGQENIPAGPCIICANHSNAVDPALLAFSLGPNVFVHFLAKAEARNIPFIKGILNKIESIFVRRGERDIESVKHCLRYLKKGEKILMFPEGTRVHGDNQVPAQTGAIHLSAKLGVPILPVYIPRDKKFGKRVQIVIGKPYTVAVDSHSDFQALADDLMTRIFELGKING